MLLPKTTSLGRERVEDALHDAGGAVLDLFPEALEPQLDNLRRCGTAPEFREAEEDLIGAIIALTGTQEPVDADGHAICVCPLCRTEIVAPTGALRCHLRGWHGTRHCRPMRAAMRFLWDCIHDEAVKRATRDSAEREARRATGPVYRFELDSPPCLFDEGLLLASEARRSEADLPEVEADLAALGFRRVVEGIEVRFELVRADAYVLADPRQKGRISFMVYLPDEVRTATSGRRSTGRSLDARRICLLDQWTEGRGGKLDASIQTAVWQMTPDERS